MLMTDHDMLRQELAPLMAKYEQSRSALIPMLQSVQAKYSRISPFAMQIIADMLGIHPVEVMGVVSFYSFLNTEPKGRFIIRLCRTISCDMVGREKVARQLQTDLGVEFGRTTADGKFTLEWANCLGLCDQGPALLVNSKAYTKVTPESVHAILEECRQTYGLHAQEKKEEHTI